MDKTKLLDKAAGSSEERLMLAKILDRLEQAIHRNIPASTDFLSPQEQALALSLLKMAGVRETEYVTFGGYEGAERKIFVFLPDWMQAEDALGQSPIRCLRSKYRPEYELTHRDFLGSLMGLGITREKVGDLLVGKDTCDLLVLDSVEQFLLQNWDGAGRAKLTISRMDSGELQVPDVQTEEMRDTVMSLRLDAVASTGFKMARSKAASLIQSGRVQVNWKDCTKPDRLLEEGDTVSARGFGKFEVALVGGVTKKGRTSITLRRYG